MMYIGDHANIIKRVKIFISQFAFWIGHHKIFQLETENKCYFLKQERHKQFEACGRN